MTFISPSYAKSEEFLLNFFSLSLRMHLALKAYQELLMTMHEMDHSQEEAVRNSSHILKSKDFFHYIASDFLG